MKKICLFLFFPAIIILSGQIGINSDSKFVIAVLDFKDATGDSSFEYLKIAAPEIFATNMAQSKDITVLERDRVKKILKENGLVMAGITDGETKRIGKLLAAKQLLSGTIVKTGRKLRIDVRLTDIDTGKILISDKRRCRTVDDIIDSIDILSERIINKITGKTVSLFKDSRPDITPTIKGNFIDLELLPQNRFHLSNSDKPLFIRAGFYAKEVKMNKKRLPLNLSIVLDRSGSMSNKGKLGFAKKAIKFIIKNLSKSDIVSVVAYDDEVNVIISPVKSINKSKMLAQINNIEPGGSTNLSGGMLEGYSLVKKNHRSGQVNRVLLISDGLANVGITDPKKIQQIVRKKSRENISISTFGVGEYFNEKLMTGIAEYGNANYYYIDQSDKIPEILSNELAGLLAVVAQNCSIEIRPLGRASVKDVYGYKYNKNTDSVKISMGDIVSEENKLALISIIPPKRRPGKKSIAKIFFSYDDAVTDKGRITRMINLKITFTKSKKIVNKNQNEIVLNDVEMYRSSDLMEDTMDMVDRGNIDKAKENINSNLSRVRNLLKKSGSRDMKKQTLNIINYQMRLTQIEKRKKKYGRYSPESFQDMQKSSRNMQYKLRKRK